jgi:hypothetical protein
MVNTPFRKLILEVFRIIKQKGFVGYIIIIIIIIYFNCKWVFTRWQW